MSASPALPVLEFSRSEKVTIALFSASALACDTATTKQSTDLASTLARSYKALSLSAVLLNLPSILILSSWSSTIMSGLSFCARAMIVSIDMSPTCRTRKFFCSVGHAVSSASRLCKSASVSLVAARRMLSAILRPGSSLA